MLRNNSCQRQQTLIGVPICYREVLVGDVVRTCRLERAAAAVDAALQCIFQMAANPALQVGCFQKPWHRRSKPSHPPFASSNRRCQWNEHAFLCALDM